MKIECQPGARTLSSLLLLLAASCHLPLPENLIRGDGQTADVASSRDGHPTVPDGPPQRTEAGPPPCVPKKMPLTETLETLEVPLNVNFMHVKAWGGGGNDQGKCVPQDDAGISGFTEAVFPAEKGAKLIVIVGKMCSFSMSEEAIMRSGFCQSAAGGLSGVFRGPAPITEHDRARALIIAGGGGSAGGPNCTPGGTGNHLDAGGMQTMRGGKGLDDDINGGAGGYSGGTGGAKREASQGGTGFVAAGALSQRLLWVERNASAPPRTDDPDYDGQAGKPEQRGLVVIHFTCEQPAVP